MRRIPFSKVRNFRDLGGFPINLQQATQFGRLFRTDVPFSLKSAEMRYLHSLNITTAIDLRNDEEVGRVINLLAGEKTINYVRVPFLNTTQMTHQQEEKAGLFERKLEDIYLEIVENKEGIKQVLEIIANAPDAVVFNCSAGKDRTGIIAALLLKLVDVSDLDVIADYEVSFTLLLERTNYLKEKYPDFKIHIMQSKRESMIFLLDYLRTTYGTITDYLLSTGLSEETLKKIKAKLLD